MVRHIVLLTFDADTTADHIDTVAEALRALPGRIPEIRHYAVGRNIGVNVDNADLAAVAEFDDVDDYLAYRDHPSHQAVIRELMAPRLAHRAAIQMSLD